MATSPTADRFRTNPIEKVDLPPSNVFQPVEEETIFSGSDTTEAELPPPVNPVTAQVAGLASLDDSSGGGIDTLTMLRQHIEEASAALERGEEMLLRSDAAVKRSLKRQTAVRNVAMPELPEQLRKDMILRAAQDSAATFEANMKAALEREAIDKIEDLAAAGDYTQARLMMNRYTPGKMDAADVWRDHTAKQLIWAEIAAQFKAEDDNEGYLQAAYSGLISLFQPSAFSYLGNVPKGLGFDEEFWRFFKPGGDIRRQAEFLHRMTPEELGANREAIMEAIRSNSTNLGGYNPDKAVELSGMLANPIGESEALGLSVMSNLENALFVAPGVGNIPYRLTQRAVSVPFVMAKAGARKEAAAKVSEAFETLIKEGPEAAAQKHAVDPDTIVDNAMPTAINPQTSGVDDGLISLSNEVGYDQEVVREFLKEWNLVKTERFTDAAEMKAAADDILNRVKERLGSGQVLDHNVVEIKLADGTVTRRLQVTLADPKGRLFATSAEAQGFAEAKGFGNVITIDQTGKIVKETRTTPRDEGFDYLVYHGTTESFEEFQPSLDGKLGSGVYVTPEPDVARTYAESLGKVSGTAVLPGPNIRPQLVKKDKVFGLEQASRGWMMEEIPAAAKAMGLPKKVVKEILRKMEDQGGEFYDSWDLVDDAAAFYRNKNKDFSDPSGMEGVNKALQKNGYEGVAATFGPDFEINIFDPKNVRSALEANIVRDISEGFAVRVEMDIPDTAFLTNPLKPPEQGFLAKTLQNVSQTSDATVFGKAVQADQKFNRFTKLIETNLLNKLKKLNNKERMWLEQILMKGQNEERWFSESEFSVLAERAMGSPPSERMIDGYKQYKFNNDVEHALRNDGVYREKVIRGYESIKFSAYGDQFDIDGKIDYTPTIVPQQRVFNISDELHYVGDKKLTAQRLQDQAARGYILFRTEVPIKLKDGTEVNYFMAKKDDIEFGPLRREQLAYSPGGHRLYSDKYLVKQTSKGIQPDTGQKFLRNPNTFATGPTIKDVRDWALTMNAARIAVKEGETAAYLDEVIFVGRGGPQDKGMAYPSGEEFIADVQKGRIDLDEPFEAVFDREMPEAYQKAGPDIEKFVDEENLKGSTSHAVQTGRMYYSSKGDALRSTRGGLAPTVDPFTAQSQALYNVARMSGSFSDFKTNAIDRWANTYRDYLNVRELPEDQTGSAVSIFNNAVPRRGLSPLLVRQMEGQRESIKRILGFESEFDRNYRQWMRGISEWIVGDSDNMARKKIAEGVFWLQDNNPVSFLRGLAFDMKLGMFNVGQFFIQTSTMASAMALNPRHGKFGLASAIPVWSYFLSKGSENVLDTLAKRGVHKLGGFSDETEFKAYVREAHRSGFFDLGDTHVLVNDAGPNTTFGTLEGGVHNVREMGRWFFYNAEVLNRLVAHRIAYGEAVEKFGKGAIGDVFAREFIARRAENYSFNMSNVSKSWWQSGLLSVPTQFWAYNVRMIEALVGRNFTAPQKLRLLGMQMMMAGAGGVPIVAGLADYVKAQHGVEPEIGTMASVIDRGFADQIIYAITGADVEIGERWGTGGWSSDLYKDLFGMSEYGPKTPAGMIFGATGSIAFTTLGPMMNIIMHYASFEGGNQEVDLVEDEWLRLAKQISTINNTLKAVMVYQYGALQSTKGTTLATGIPSQSAWAVALGFRPHELEASSVYKNYLDNRSEAIRDAATQIKNWRQEAFTQPDLLEENAKKANAFMQLLPDDIRKDVLRQAHKEIPDSFYSGIQDRMKDVRRKEAIAAQTEGLE